jgi:hypothetical protein
VDGSPVQPETEVIRGRKSILGIGRHGNSGVRQVLPGPAKATERKTRMRKIVVTLVVILAGLLAMAAKPLETPVETPAKPLLETPVETPAKPLETPVETPAKPLLPLPPWQISLSGAAEPDGGDPDGSGVATLSLNYGGSTLCWNVSWENIDDPTAGHIHVGPAGVAGPVVIPFTDAAGVFAASGCQTVDQMLLKAIKEDPAAYYVNLHNAAYPAGAIRGQLTEPPMVGP